MLTHTHIYIEIYSICPKPEIQTSKIGMCFYSMALNNNECFSSSNADTFVTSSNVIIKTFQFKKKHNSKTEFN